MNMTTNLAILALIAWSIQITLGWFQIRRFNRAFLSMKKGTYLGVGRNQTQRFKPKVLIALSLDHDKKVIDSIWMKGVTVFALPKPIPQLYGLNITDIMPETIFPNDIASQSALILALKANK